MNQQFPLYQPNGVGEVSCKTRSNLFLLGAIACVGGGIWYGYSKRGAAGAVVGGLVGAVPGVPLMAASALSSWGC